MMPHIEALARDQINDKELLAAVDSLEATGAPGAWFIAFIARDPANGKGLLRMLEVINERGNVPLRTKHLVRYLLAQVAGDEYSAAISANALAAEGFTGESLDELMLDYDRNPAIGDDERVALRFAEQMFLDAKKIDDAFYDDLRRHYSEPQIMELATVIGVNFGLARVIAAVGATPDEDHLA